MVKTKRHLCQVPKSEQKKLTLYIKKDATAVIETIRKWFNFLKNRTFTLFFYQLLVLFTFDKTKQGKIKNLLWLRFCQCNK